MTILFGPFIPPSLLVTVIVLTGICIYIILTAFKTLLTTMFVLKDNIRKYLTIITLIISCTLIAWAIYSLYFDFDSIRKLKELVVPTFITAFVAIIYLVINKIIKTRQV